MQTTNELEKYKTKVGKWAKDKRSHFTEEVKQAFESMFDFDLIKSN